MTNEFLWEKQLEEFKKVYLSSEVKEEYRAYQDEMLEQGVYKSKSFRPKAAKKLYTTTNNMQYHLNGRSILGILRMWSWYEENETIYTKHGCSINTGLIQSDHSGFMRSGNLGEVFIQAKSGAELEQIARRLLDLSNEEMVREFNIASSKNDMATLFNAIILDAIIEYEIERENFGGYTSCWNDSNSIEISNKNGEAYRIEGESTDYEVNQPLTIFLPNGETVTFKQKFNEKKGETYTIDDISAEILEVKGNSELLQCVVAQVERFSEKELTQGGKETISQKERTLNSLRTKKEALETELAQINEQIR